MEQRPFDTQRSLDPSAKEFHPTPAQQKNHTFMRSTSPPPPPIVVFHPTSPQLPMQSQIFLPYKMSAFYFHVPIASPQPLMFSVPPQHVTEQGTLIRPGNNIYPERQPTNDGGADSMCSSSLENDVVLVKKWSKGLDWRFVVNDDTVISGDSRTTLMIKNIPNKYSLKLLLSTLDNHCAHCNDQIIRGGGAQAARFSSYDFVYLPMDFNNKCNVGYGFVNMTSTDATVRLYKAFHGRSWEVFNSLKICQVTYARLQGLETLKEHFRNSRFPSGRDEEVLPVLFDPPRDGRQQLTPPQPVYVVVDSTDNGSYQRQSV